MRDIPPSETTIRQYLLGRLDNQDAMEEDLSKQIFLNDELSDLVGSVEDEIIEEYLDGTLNAADKRDVTEYFLRPPERQRKLRFARLLRQRLETESAVMAEAKLTVTPLRTEGGLTTHWQSHVRAYAEAAAFILICVSGFLYITGVRWGLQSQIADARKDQERLADELSREHTLSAHLAQRLQDLQMTQQPAVAMLLLVPGQRGADEKAPELEIRPSTQRIRTELILRGSPSSPYDVSLELKGQEILREELLPIVAPGGALLVVELSPQGIAAGNYQFVIKPRRNPAGEKPQTYDFQVKRIE